MDTEKPARVLLVDDAESIRDLFRIALGLDRRFEVVGEASDGLEAVERAKELKPDVILLDIAMPRLDGLQAIPMLHEVAEGTRIIIVSGFESEAMAERAMALCASAVLTKGIPISAMTERIHDIRSRPPKRVCPAPA